MRAALGGHSRTNGGWSTVAVFGVRERAPDDHDERAEERDEDERGDDEHPRFE